MNALNTATRSSSIWCEAHSVGLDQESFACLNILVSSGSGVLRERGAAVSSQNVCCQQDVRSIIFTGFKLPQLVDGVIAGA